MNKTFLMATICLFSWVNVVAAPEWPINNNRVMVTKPKELKRNIIRESDLKKFISSGNWGQPAKLDYNSKSIEYWNVWSDRSQNITFNGPSESSGQYKELDFNQPLRIAKIEKGYALVYDEPMAGITSPIISQHAVCMGWIKMDHLLLWESCPTNDKGIYQKAVIVASAEGWSKAGDYGYDRSYKNPTTGDGESKVKTDMKFYFVMKYWGDGDKRYALLAKSSKMNAGSTDRQLYAWVSINTYVPWNERTCLEGNWDPRVAENLKGKTVGIYKDGQLGMYVTLGEENGVTTSPATKYRAPKENLRFPLLGTTNTEYTITAFGSEDGNTGKLKEDKVEIKKAMQGRSDEEKMTEEANKINLIVVIDGTSSMENYYKPMQDAIQKAYETFGNQNGVKVRAGVVIYRDYADGEFMTEIQKLTDPNSEKLKEFLANGGKYGIKSSPKDRTSAEALYQGLYAALDAKKMGYTEFNSNLLFVVGDCGNDANDTKIKQQNIIDKCAELNINLVAFQVRNKDDASFNDFRRQMTTILKNNIKKQYGDGSTKWNLLPDGMVLKGMEDTETPVMAAMRYADKGEEMSPQKLNDIIKENYLLFKKAVSVKIDKIIHADEYFVKKFEQTSDVKDMVRSKIDSAFYKRYFTPQQIENIKSSGLITAFNGQAAQKDPNGQDYWSPVLFITGDEFSNLLETLKTVYNGASSGNRKAYVDSIKKLIQTILPGISDEEMNNKDVQEIMNMVTGLAVKTESLNRHTIREILDEKLVSPNEFGDMITQFKEKYEYLSNIRSTNYEFSVVVQGVRWYWLPVDKLP